MTINCIITIGDQIEVLLERLENDEGIVVLSKEKAAHKQNWDKIVGCLLYTSLTRKAAQILGGSCDIEVMAMHHRHKIDAPSGTARTLAQILSGAIGRNYEDSVVFGLSLIHIRCV